MSDAHSSPSDESASRPEANPRRNGLATFRSFLGRVDYDFVTIAVLFAALRLFATLFFEPGGLFFSYYGDFQFYRRLAELSIGGLYPYLDYWMEYPPVFPWLLIGVYRLSLFLPAWPDSMVWFQVTLSSFFGLVDLAILFLVYRIGSRLGGRETGLRSATCYALLFFPAWVALGWFDTLPLFFLLLAVSLSGSRHHLLAGLAAGIGVMTKLIPGVAAPSGLLGAATWRQRLLYGAAFVVAIVGIGAPFAVLNADMTHASIRAMLGRSSWETVWSCLEGYCDVGVMPQFSARFDVTTATTQVHAESLPWPEINAVFGLSLLWLYTRKLRWQDPRVAVTAVALTANLLLLFSRGYSPQFMIYPLAFLAILKPNPVGVIQACLLTALNLIEHPFPILYFPAEDRLPLQQLTIGTRTLLLTLLTVEYALVLSAQNGRIREVLRSAVVGSFLLFGTVGLVAASSMVLARFSIASPTRELADRVAAFGRADDVVVVSSRNAFYRVRPDLTARDWLLAEEDGGQWPLPLSARLDSLITGRTGAWLILDEWDHNGDARARMLDRLDRWGSRTTDERFGQYRLVGYSSYDSADEARTSLDASFGGRLSVVGVGSLPDEARPGQAIRLGLRLRCDVAPDRPLKIFAYVVNAEGRMLAHRDKPLPWRGQTVTQCRPGDTLWDSTDLIVPDTAEAGDYRIVVGFYDADSGGRLRIASPNGRGEDHLKVADVHVSSEEVAP